VHCTHDVCIASILVALYHQKQHSTAAPDHPYHDIVHGCLGSATNNKAKQFSKQKDVQRHNADYSADQELTHFQVTGYHHSSKFTTHMAAEQL